MPRCWLHLLLTKSYTCVASHCRSASQPLLSHCYIVFFIFYLCLQPVIGSARITSLPPGVQYSIFLDGGSTSTKLRIYKWTKPLTRDEIPNFTEITTKRFEPGISEYYDNVTAIGDYIQPMVLMAIRNVPVGLHSQTPIYFMATAGLRVLRGHVTLSIIQQLSAFLEEPANNPFYFRPGHVQVLSGEEEAVFAWVAVNYLRGFFHKKQNSSVGVLEMGGGSTQIVFIPKLPIYANKFIIHIGSQYYQTYAHSYLNFGQRYIIERVTSFLITKHHQTSKPYSRINDPCRLKGDNKNVTHGENTITLVGAGDADECLEILKLFLNKQSVTNCSPKPCAIGTTYMTPVHDMIFYAVAAFVYPSRIINSTDSDERLNIELMVNDTKKYCKLTVTEAVEQRGTASEYASSNCISGVFIPLLLVVAYGFPKNTTSIYLKEKIQNGTPDWSLGAQIYQTELMRDGCESQSLTTYSTTLSGAVSLTTLPTSGSQSLASGTQILMVSTTFLTILFHLSPPVSSTALNK